jgi:hypothetical protein
MRWDAEKRGRRRVSPAAQADKTPDPLGTLRTEGEAISRTAPFADSRKADRDLATHLKDPRSSYLLLTSPQSGSTSSIWNERSSETRSALVSARPLAFIQMGRRHPVNPLIFRTKTPASAAPNESALVPSLLAPSDYRAGVRVLLTMTGAYH